MILTLSEGSKSSSVALRPDTAEYLQTVETVNPSDRRIKDLILAAWAVARQLK
jgi:hypothetical protein